MTKDPMAFNPASLDEDDLREAPATLDWPLLERLPAQLAEQQHSPEGFREAIRVAQEDLKERFYAEEAVEALVRARAQFIDLVLTIAWQQKLDASLAERLALLAVGGYGRGELHPASDIDILVLVLRRLRSSTASARRSNSLVAFLWDIGLEVGHSVRTVAECAQESAADVGVMTTLLEARLHRRQRASSSRRCAPRCRPSTSGR